jgi:hypothetical protein
VRLYSKYDIKVFWRSWGFQFVQAISLFLWKPEVLNRVHKRPLAIYPYPEQDDANQRLYHLYFKSILILFSHLRVRLASCLFPTVFFTNTLYTFLIIVWGTYST